MLEPKFTKIDMAAELPAFEKLTTSKNTLYCFQNKVVNAIHRYKHPMEAQIRDSSLTQPEPKRISWWPSFP